MKAIGKVTVLALAASVAIFSTSSAMAGIGRSSSSKSSSSSSSSSASKRSSSSESSRASRSDSGRVGGGRSMGMSRESTMSSIRESRSSSSPANNNSYRSAPAPAPAQNYQAPASSFRPSNNYAAPAAPARERSGSWVAPALAGAAVGAVAGYALSNNNSDHSAANQQPMQPPQATQANTMASANTETAHRAPAKPAANLDEGTTGMGWMLWALVALALIIGALVWAIRRESKSGPLGSGQSSTARVASSSAATTSGFKTSESRVEPRVATQSFSDSRSTKADDDAAVKFLRDGAPSIYRRLQLLNNQGDLRALKSISTPEMYEALREDIESRESPSRTEVLAIHQSEVRDVEREGGRLVASIWYKSELDEHEGQGTIDAEEVFHFVREDGHNKDWLLAGIEQLDDAT